MFVRLFKCLSLHFLLLFPVKRRTCIFFWLFIYLSALDLFHLVLWKLFLFSTIKMQTVSRFTFNENSIVSITNHALSLELTLLFWSLMWNIQLVLLFSSVSYMSLYVLFSVMWKSDIGQIHNLIPGNCYIKKSIILLSLFWMCKPLRSVVNIPR